MQTTAETTAKGKSVVQIRDMNNIIKVLDVELSITFAEMKEKY